MMKRLNTYLDVYDNNPKITFIKNNIEDNKNTLLKLLDYDI